MTKATTPVLPVPSNVGLQTGMPFTTYIKGTDTYEKLRLNGSVDLAREDGSKAKGTVVSMQVGALIDLLIGSANPGQMYAQGSSPLATLQGLTDASSEDVLDVTKLYTLVTVSIPMPAPAPV